MYSNSSLLKGLVCMMIVRDVNALQLFGHLIMKLSNHPGVTSLMKGTNRHAYIFCLIPQTLKKEKPKPIEGNQQTEEIILTKGTKGETFFPWMKTHNLVFYMITCCSKMWLSCLFVCLSSPNNTLWKDWQQSFFKMVTIWEFTTVFSWVLWLLYSFCFWKIVLIISTEITIWPVGKFQLHFGWRVLLRIPSLHTGQWFQ